MELIFFALVLLSGFAATSIGLPPFIRRMHARGIVGKDINKLSQPPVAEMGGTIVLMGFIFSIMAGLFFHTYLGFLPNLELLPVLAAMLTIVLVGLLGIIDDLIGWKKGIRQYQHALFPIFAALPIMVLPQTIGSVGLDLPFIGVVSFGIWYSLLVVPIAITGASNAANMLAGLNGLEVGLGLISSITLLLIAFWQGEFEVVFLLLGIIGAFLAFMRFNWFPAQIFPGDALTLMMGATIAAVSIIGNMEKLGLMLFGLYFIELVLKARSKMQAQSFGIPQPDGTLKAPEKIGSLTHVVMRWGKGKWNEKQVVLVLLGLQLLIALVVVAYYHLNSMLFFQQVF